LQFNIYVAPLQENYSTVGEIEAENSNRLIAQTTGCMAILFRENG